jgi:hypothetical protein
MFSMAGCQDGDVVRVLNYRFTSGVNPDNVLRCPRQATGKHQLL